MAALSKHNPRPVPVFLPDGNAAYSYAFEPQPAPALAATEDEFDRVTRNDLSESDTFFRFAAMRTDPPRRPSAPCKASFLEKGAVGSGRAQILEVLRRVSARQNGSDLGLRQSKSTIAADVFIAALGRREPSRRRAGDEQAPAKIEASSPRAADPGGLAPRASRAERRSSRMQCQTRYCSLIAAPSPLFSTMKPWMNSCRPEAKMRSMSAPASFARMLLARRWLSPRRP